MFAGDDDLIGYVRRLVGYGVTGDVRDPRHLEETFESVEIPVPAAETVDSELGSLAAA